MTFCILTGIEEIISESEPNLVVLVVTTELFIGGGGGGFSPPLSALSPPYIYKSEEPFANIIFGTKKNAT